MNEGFQNIAKAPERITTEKVKGLKEQLREKLLDILDPVLRKFFDIKEVDEDFRRLLKAQNDTEQLSAETGEFFRSLIPGGLRKPEIDSVPYAGSSNWIMMLERTKIFKIFDQKTRNLTRKEYRKQKKEMQRDSIHGREKIGAYGEVKETESTLGNVEQVVENVYEQDGNQNLIYERVSNRLNRQRKTNHVESSLVIQDIESGTTLDLNALLPSDYKFIPRAMDKELFQPDVESPITGISYMQEEVADLRDYKMSKSTPEDFAVRPFYKNVDYGDIRETGGILSLLHEIAHSWQDKYYHTMGQDRTEFERLYKKVVHFISKLDLSKNDEQYEEPEKIWEKLEKIGIECLDKNGLKTPINEEGVINISNTYYDLVKLIEMIDLSDERISEQQKEQVQALLAESKSRIRFYPIKSSALQKLMDAYILEERDAWAHAIRTIRFLRRKGFNMEPELKELADFKKIINPCLASHQNNLWSSI